MSQSTRSMTIMITEIQRTPDRVQQVFLHDGLVVKNIGQIVNFNFFSNDGKHLALPSSTTMWRRAIKDFVMSKMFVH